jgi:hypothetical protein
LFAQNIKRSERAEADLKNNIVTIKAELYCIEEAASAKRKSANEMFESLRQALNEREAAVH